MIWITVKTCVTNLLFTIQPQLPKKKVISTSHRKTPNVDVAQVGRACKERNFHTYIYIFMYVT